MKNIVRKSLASSRLILSDEELRLFFINNLNRVYCAKSHLVERLEDVSQETDFLALKECINGTISATEMQFVKINQIYDLLDVKYSFEECKDLVDFLEDTFSSIHKHQEEPGLFYMNLLNYLINVEGLENISARILKLAASKLKKDAMSKLLSESFDMFDPSLTNMLTDFIIQKC